MSVDEPGDSRVLENVLSGEVLLEVKESLRATRTGKRSSPLLILVLEGLLTKVGGEDSILLAIGVEVNDTSLGDGDVSKEWGYDHRFVPTGGIQFMSKDSVLAPLTGVFCLIGEESMTVEAWLGGV